MKILKTTVIFFLAIVCSVNVYGEKLNPEDYDRFFDYGKFAHMRAIEIMNMINQSKSKSKDKILSVMLEIELNCLYSETKEVLDRSVKDQHKVKRSLKELAGYEKRIETLKEGLHHVEEWKNQYCN